ncbi:hypothetical protein MOQ_001544 [Trypanosoma cruzi marinkellei]|uniref:Uncharacterized protein n=1 Tax=Trypanosoma cruzi marinkellei TaxID=85056 RepID=K2MSH4_TRYCR|nr:hypothetical protein MOQ_001544 [Trypanosoma cruzi marinkellei]
MLMRMHWSSLVIRRLLLLLFFCTILVPTDPGACTDACIVRGEKLSLHFLLLLLLFPSFLFFFPRFSLVERARPLTALDASFFAVSLWARAGWWLRSAGRKSGLRRRLKKTTVGRAENYMWRARIACGSFGLFFTRRSVVVPSNTDAEELFQRIVRPNSVEDMSRRLSGSMLVSCVAVIELKRQQMEVKGKIGPMDTLLGNDTLEFLVALSKMCERRGSLAVVEDLCFNVHNDLQESNRVLFAVKTLLNALDILCNFSNGSHQQSFAVDAGKLLQLELSLLEVLVRVEGDAHGNVQEACYHMQRMQHVLKTRGIYTLTAVERRRWKRRMRWLTTVVYPHLDDCSREDEEAFKRTLRLLYGGEGTFGYINKLRYAFGVLLPFLLKNAATTMKGSKWQRKRNAACKLRNKLPPQK